MKKVQEDLILVTLTPTSPDHSTRKSHVEAGAELSLWPSRLWLQLSTSHPKIRSYPNQYLSALSVFQMIMTRLMIWSARGLRTCLVWYHIETPSILRPLTNLSPVCYVGVTISQCNCTLWFWLGTASDEYLSSCGSDAFLPCTYCTNALFIRQSYSHSSRFLSPLMWKSLAVLPSMMEGRVSRIPMDGCDRGWLDNRIFNLSPLICKPFLISGILGCRKDWLVR